MSKMNRRSFFRKSAGTAAAVATAGIVLTQDAAPVKSVTVGSKVARTLGKLGVPGSEPIIDTSSVTKAVYLDRPSLEDRVAEIPIEGRPSLQEALRILSGRGSDYGEYQSSGQAFHDAPLLNTGALAVNRETLREVHRRGVARERVIRILSGHTAADQVSVVAKLQEIAPELWPAIATLHQTKRIVDPREVL